MVQLVATTCKTYTVSDNLLSLAPLTKIGAILHSQDVISAVCYKLLPEVALCELVFGI